MSKKDWVYMPHAGHLCVARWCQFHLNTYVNGYIVSTVGEYFPPVDHRRCILESRLKVPFWNWSKEKINVAKKILGEQGDIFDDLYLREYGYDEIGLGRTYETMVFKARKSSLGCCPYIMADCESLWQDGYNSSTEAFEGHNDLCKKYDKEKPNLP